MKKKNKKLKLDVNNAGVQLYGRVVDIWIAEEMSHSVGRYIGF